MPSDAASLSAVLAPYGLVFISGWHSLKLLARSVEEEIVAIQPHLDLLKAMGSEVCIACETANAVHAADTPLAHRPTLPAGEWADFGARVEAVAAHCAQQGIELVYHHHMGTIVQTRAEIDTLMTATGPATKLLLDTGHAHFAGADPADVARDHMPRIRHIHAKNVRSAVLDEARTEGLSFLDAVRRGVFTVPGDAEGDVDFPSVLAVAASAGYRGWLVVEAEQDPSTRDPRHYQGLGLTVLRAMAGEAGFGSA